MEELLKCSPPPLGASGWEVRSYGVGGTTVSPGTQYVHTQRYRMALRAGADAVVIMFGTNDADTRICKRWDGQGYAQGIRKLVASFRATRSTCPWARGDEPPHVLLMTPPPVYHNYNCGAKMSIVNELLPEHVLPALSSELQVGLLDVFNALGGKDLRQLPYMTHDGVHPNKKGQAVIAGVVRDGLIEAALSRQLYA